MKRELKKPTSFALTPTAKMLVELLAAKKGLSVSYYIEMRIREDAEVEGIKIPQIRDNQAEGAENTDSL
jgi:hypothetical protein